jgi:hypothetical protein
MANLKQDILNNLGNEKYYAELELARLAQEPNMYYKEKVEVMSGILKNLASLDLATQLVSKYFQDPPAPAEAPAEGQPQTEGEPAPEQPAPAPEQPAPHQGQSHAE